MMSILSLRFASRFLPLLLLGGAMSLAGCPFLDDIFADEAVAAIHSHRSFPNQHVKDLFFVVTQHISEGSYGSGSYGWGSGGWISTEIL